MMQQPTPRRVRAPWIAEKMARRTPHIWHVREWTCAEANWPATWLCAGRGYCAQGDTFWAAYDNWLAKVGGMI